jgi:hypothetical protein
MPTWQFWTLFTLLVLILWAALGVKAAAEALWTKLHEVQEAIGRRPSLDYRDELERLARLLERLGE